MDSLDGFLTHKCIEGLCICPVHKTALYYSPNSGEHACQDPDCIHAHGVIHGIDNIMRAKIEKGWPL